MKNDLTCEVVQDLLPSYVDGLTSDVSNQAVEQHLKMCESCKKLYSEMKEPMNGEDVSEINDGQKADSKRLSEIDYLKKIRKTNRMRILTAVLLVVIVVGVGIWCKVYVIGQKVEQAEFVYSDVVVDGQKVSLQGMLLDTSKGVADVAFQEQDGIVTVSLRETKKSSFHTNEFQADYDSTGEVKQVVLENRILWDDGISIDGTISNLYQSRNPYVGDTSADGRALQAAREVLGINDGALLCDGTQLQTAEEPYGWTFLNVQISSSDNVERLQQEMKQLGCLLIAVTDNLGYVSFDYNVDGAENADQNTTLTVTEADADALVGQSVKAMAQTPAGLQQLVERVR